MKKYLNLFLIMMKIGLFTFGGGYAMISLLENEFVNKKEWINKDEFLDMVAIAESTPGPIAINAATYLGYKMYGFFGALVATIAVCIPSFFIIYIISLFFNAFLEIKLVSYAFKGIQICVIYLIFSSGLRMLKKMKKNAFNIIIFIACITFLVTFSFLAIDFSSIYYILICGVSGIFTYLITSLINKKKEEKK